MSGHRLIALAKKSDPRGNLFIAEKDKLPFTVKRIFILSDVQPGAGRGGHAHRAQHQFLFMAAGHARVTVDNGQGPETVILNGPGEGLYAPPMLWLELSDFSAGAVCVVGASDAYDEADYIRDFDAFLRLGGGV
jgi:hypothetical protein